MSLRLSQSPANARISDERANLASDTIETLTEADRSRRAWLSWY